MENAICKVGNGRFWGKCEGVWYAMVGEGDFDTFCQVRSFLCHGHDVELKIGVVDNDKLEAKGF